MCVDFLKRGMMCILRDDKQAVQTRINYNLLRMLMQVYLLKIQHELVLSMQWQQNENPDLSQQANKN